MDKPSLRNTIMSVANQVERPTSLKNLNQADMEKIIRLCEEYEFVKSNRTDFNLAIIAILEQVISR